MSSAVRREPLAINKHQLSHPIVAVSPSGKNMKTIIILALACFTLYLTGCTSLNKTLASQDAAIVQFHEHYNSGKMDAIWDGAHAKFQGSTEKVYFVAYMKEVQSKLGKVTSSANVDRRMQTPNQTTTVFLSQDTIFERGKGIETFTIQMDGERAILVAYNVQSKAFVAK